MSIVGGTCGVFVDVGDNIRLLEGPVPSIVKREEQFKTKTFSCAECHVQTCRCGRLSSSDVQGKGIDMSLLSQTNVRLPLFCVPRRDISNLRTFLAFLSHTAKRGFSHHEMGKHSFRGGFRRSEEDQKPRESHGCSEDS